MSMGSQIAAFCKDVSKNKKMWTILFEDDSLLKWENEDGSVVIPIWSTQTRVEKAISLLVELENIESSYLPLEIFIDEWAPELDRSQVRVGPNWSGDNLSGTTFGALEIIQRIKRYETEGESNT
ncbi:hypothetical protein AYJ58_06235 [Shewanella sp. Pdp11]|uniref:DUF2750 domain-containing protein n=1 Tax=Shewanella sp. Pdp11 TaxID=2059264 RepID=UPI000CA1C577|nr:DUF2750 domain-containing protein [Shewanella sp. Pdp11]AUD59113.1 hypothetical protein AYJ58_06235 [Shewanella sp. Pdp11]